MILGFEDITARLTENEKSLVPQFIDRMKLRIGKDKAVTSKQIISGFAAMKNPVKISGPRIRKIINYIRMQNLVPGLIATSDGYYVATTKDELKNYIESLRGRELAIRGIRQQIELELNKL